MACQQWREKIQAYADGELSAAELQAFEAHRRSCAACAEEALTQLEWKRALHRAGSRHVASPALRRRVQQSVSKVREPVWRAAWLRALASAAAVLIVAFAGVARWEVASRQRTFTELADLHVATLASSMPVEVVSSDRHTVKPWFAGRIPFAFDLPELAGSPYTLLGGRVAYLEREAGAHLLFQIRQHRISVFIFPERESPVRWLGAERTPSHHAGFTVETWSSGGLRYFAVSDVGPEDLHRLAELFRAASPPL